jgi:cell division protein FtsI/penicillin-binding protein 2
MDLKEFYEDKKFVHSRIPLVQVATILVFLLLLVGLWNLQLLKSKYYQELAERNRIRSILRWLQEARSWTETGRSWLTIGLRSLLL